MRGAGVAFAAVLTGLAGMTPLLSPDSPPDFEQTTATTVTTDPCDRALRHALSDVGVFEETVPVLVRQNRVIERHHGHLDGTRYRGWLATTDWAGDVASHDTRPHRTTRDLLACIDYRSETR
jgi:hypothetical protein